MKDSRRRKLLPLALIMAVILALVSFGAPAAFAATDQPVSVITINGNALMNGETAYYSAAIKPRDINVASGHSYTITRDNGEPVVLTPSLNLPVNHKYTVQVSLGDLAVAEVYFYIDTAKPAVSATGLKKGAADDDFVAYTSNAWTNGVVKVKLSVNTEPVSGYHYEYFNVSSTLPELATPQTWTPIEGDELVLFSGEDLNAEITSQYKFRAVSNSGYISGEKTFNVRIDQVAPVLTTITPVKVDGYPAYGKNTTFKFTDINGASGSYGFTIDPALFGPAGDGSSRTFNGVNVRSFALTESGIYTNMYVEDSLGNRTEVDDFIIDKAVPVLPAVTAAKADPDLSHSAVVVSLSPTIEDGHQYKLQYSMDNAVWEDFPPVGRTTEEAIQIADDYAKQAVEDSQDEIGVYAEDWAGRYTEQGAVDDNYEEIYQILYDYYYVVFVALYEEFYPTEIAQLYAAEYADMTAAFYAESGAADYDETIQEDIFLPLYLHAKAEKAQAVYDEVFNEKYEEAMTVDPEDLKKFTIFPKAGEKNTDRYYFRAVNVNSGLNSTVRSYTANIGPAPLP